MVEALGMTGECGTEPAAPGLLTSSHWILSLKLSLKVCSCASALVTTYLNFYANVPAMQCVSCAEVGQPGLPGPPTAGDGHPGLAAGGWR